MGLATFVLESVQLQVDPAYTGLHIAASAGSQEKLERTDSKVRGPRPPPDSISHTVLSRHQRNPAKCHTTDCKTVVCGRESLLTK